MLGSKAPRLAARDPGLLRKGASSRYLFGDRFEFIDRRGKPELSLAGPVPVRASRPWRSATTALLGNSLYRTGGLVLLQVGTAFVTPTEGQLYEPTDGAVTVPMDVPDVP
jgi:hypothetical protein